jgi:hypothetical protein
MKEAKFLGGHRPSPPPEADKAESEKIFGHQKHLINTLVLIIINTIVILFYNH